ncbi:DUF4863 family protein [Neorhizobium galegae]|uniref:p-hydroxylaminobenzoate lyase n=1 Tax=Neorhizobium galegae bv. orientalis str. HAMBI 540 TaxID=1028800 RepID=A0A068T0B9_NEOGA|nr:DUF4863 family protein [Neorhizobium galegae]MCQ1855962.1 DUF4863 family protein [Neorhizobium galegae]CDN51559.1 P-hydroxylaminobenzoate lyase [Neorhizobium galegae bv. orientalis str. HAMBI 540]CDZ54277.1 P-hydroxylaminobenzoate lyase [Neorhizobium galegae bv. orientalis]
MTERDELIDAAVAFIETIKDKTPGEEVELWLNEMHGPGSSVYEDLADRVRRGVEQGWAATTEITGRHYRRSRLLEPCERSHFFSLTTVYMDSPTLTKIAEHDRVFRGDYHLHPYGEFNLVVPLEPTAELMGPLGWRHAGWTAPAPGSHHYPEARGGALIAFFFLPSGRISYDIEAPRIDEHVASKENMQ